MDSNPICHPSPAQKMKCSFLDYVQLLMIGWAIRAKNVNQNAKKWKRPPKSSKNKMFVLDYVQLLMISQAIPAKNINWNAKKQKWPPKSLQKSDVCFWIMFNFWWSAEWSEQKMSTETQKNKKGPLSHWKIKYWFLHYVQLLMIGWAIWAKNIKQNVKKWKRSPKSSKNKMFIFGLCSTSDDWPSDLSRTCQPKH